MSRTVGSGHRPRDRWASAGAAGRAPELVCLAAGGWLLLAPWLLDYRGARAPLAVDLGLGVVLVVLATFRLLARPASRGVPVLATSTGLLLVIAPVVLRYGHTDRVVAAYLNDILIGLLVAAAGLVMSRQGPSADG